MQKAECRVQNEPLSSSAMPKPLSPKGDSYQNAEFTPSGREPYTFLTEEGGPLAVEGVKCFPLQGEVANAQHLTIGAYKSSKAHELLRGLHRCLGDISRIEIL